MVDVETALYRIRSAKESGAPKLFLSRLNLTQLPPELFNLTQLTHLYLDQNNLELIPPEIGNLSNLEVLHLHDNQLTTLPPEMGQLRGLMTLFLMKNNLVELPPEIGKLSALITLDLKGNQVLSRVPDEIGQLIYLESLLLKDNQLIDLPDAIGNLTHLQELSLENNKLIELPSTIGKLCLLQSLDLENNQLRNLPPEVGQLKNLAAIHLQGNQLTELPSEIGQLRALTSLDLENNRLRNLPPEVGQLKNLAAVRLQGNQLTELPSEIGQLRALTSLDLNKNKLTSLPREISQLTLLKSLSVQNNQLTTLPPEIGQLTSLVSLHLKDNQLTDLPPEIGDLANLETLSLTNNRLTNLPKSIGRLKKLRALFLRGDQIFPLPLTYRIRDWDVFISHASEDKETVALPLANALTKAGLKVWIDQRELQLGDSIRNKIDAGLSKSRFGIVILSPHFIDKTWTQRELNGLMAIEDQGEKVILPVWHNISKAMLTDYSPILSDRLAANTSDGIAAVASRIVEVVLYQQTSPSTLFPGLTGRFVQLIRASGSNPTNLRDFLIQHPRIVSRAFGWWGGHQNLSSEFFDHYPAILARSEIGSDEATLKEEKTFYLVFANAQGNPLTPDYSTETATAGCSLIENSKDLLRGKAWDEAVIIAGRRAELSESDKEQINQFNQGNKIACLSLRTYDWLIDVCVSLDKELPAR